MVDVKIVRSEDIKPTPHPGDSRPEAGWTKRIVYPPHVKTKNVFLGVAEVNPGYSNHRWHRHTKDQSGGYEAVYSSGMEGIYYIVKGNGVAQWKTEDGKIREGKVGPGDTLFFPADVAEHQLLNTGAEKMFIVFSGSPIPKVALTY